MKADDAIRIILTDDNLILRGVVKSLFETVPEINIIGEAGNGLELLETLKTKECDLILLDLSMPQMDGLTALRHIKVEYPHLKVLVYSTYNERWTAASVIKSGADGFMLKGDPFMSLLDAVKRIMKGQRYITKSLDGG